MDVARDMPSADFNADDFARKRIDEMTDAPEKKWLTPNGGLPTGNGWHESELVEYTRSDIAPKVKPLVWEQSQCFKCSVSGRYTVQNEYDANGGSCWVFGFDGVIVSQHQVEAIAQAAANRHHDALIRSALVDDIAPKLSVQDAAKVLLGVFENPDKNAPKGFDWQAMYNEMTEDHRENLVIGGHPDWPSTLTTALSALVTPAGDQT
jgi:hypothetical protein